MVSKRAFVLSANRTTERIGGKYFKHDAIEEWRRKKNTFKFFKKRHLSRSQPKAILYQEREFKISSFLREDKKKISGKRMKRIGNIP